MQVESCQLKPLSSAASSEQQLAVMLPPIVLDLPASSVRFLNITPGCFTLCSSTGPYSLHNIWPRLTRLCLSTLQNSGYLFVAQMFVWKGPREENLHQPVPRSTSSHLEAIKKLNSLEIIQLNTKTSLNTLL